jgi:RNA polymerase sigma factor (sigma-70 family)
LSLLTQIWKERQKNLKAMASAVLPTPQNVDDVLQEAFARVLKSKRRFDSYSDAYKYVHTSVLTTAIDAYRRLKRSHRFFPACDVRSAYPPSPHEDPLDLLLRAEEADHKSALMAEVHAAVRTLTPEQQQAIHAFFGNRRQASLKEYCMDTGVSYSTLRSRMLQGIDRIRERLHERNITGFDDGEEGEP